MAEEIQNKFSKHGVEYMFATDTVPTENSVKFITSGAVYEYLVSLSGFAGKNVTSTVTQYSTDLITSGAVYEALLGTAKENSGSGHLSTLQRHNVFEGTIDNTTMPTGGAGKTYFSTSANAFYYFSSSGTKYKELPQEGILYYNKEANKFCYWNGSGFAIITLS